MKRRSYLPLVPLLLFVRVATAAVAINGQISDAVTTLPLDGAAITLDLEPPDGTPEATAASDHFGFYSLPSVADGTYRLTAVRGGYDALQRAVTVEGVGRTENFALQPKAGGPYVDLYVNIIDATANIPLSGVPVVIRRYDTSSGGAPENIPSPATDANGHVALRGVKNGYYEFQLNNGAGRRNGYETYPRPAGSFTPRTHVSRPYQLMLHLKHIPQTVKIAVTGCVPSTEQEGPLKNVPVELTAVSAADHTVELTPPRGMPTDDNGAVTFPDLGPLHLRVTARRDGYAPKEIFLIPAPGTEILPGAQPGAAQPLLMDINPTALHLTLTSIYPDDNYYDGIEVTLEGIEDTNTAGIRRSLDTGSPDDERLFEKLLPGRYIAYVNDTFEPADPDTTPAPHFRADFIVEAVDGVTMETDLPLEVTPSLVRVRLQTAETPGNIQSGGRDDLVLRLPIYRPKEVPDFQMGLAAEIQTKPTDAGGGTSFLIYPGLYGFGVPSLTDYYGAHVVVRQNGDVDGRRQGWPALSGMPGYEPRDGDEGEPLVINSGGDYQIDLFANKKRANFFIRVLTTGVNPTAQVVQSIAQPPVCGPFQEILAEPAQFTLTNTGTNATTTHDVLQRDGAAVELLDIPPGTYRLTGTHPRYDIVIQGLPGGAPPDIFTVPPWPAWPGANLVWAPPPFSLYNPVSFYSSWPTGAQAVATYKATGPVTLRHYTWNEEAEPPEYVLDSTDNDPVFDYIKPAYAGGPLFCSARRPLGNFELWLRQSGGLWFHDTVAGNGAATIDIRSGGPQNNVNAASPSATGQITLRAVSRVAPDESIPGIKFRLTGSATLFDAGVVNVPAQYSGPISLAAATDPANRFVLKSAQMVTSGTYNNNVLIIAEMGRALNISGTVKINNATNAVIPRAKVQFFDRFGDARFPSRVANGSGAFSMPPTLETPAFFVEVNALGYKPKRMRYSSNDPAIGGTGNNGSLVIDIRLDPLPPPVVDPPSIDRYGMFLPYVSQASNGLGHLGQATLQLTATWQGAASPPGPTILAQPNFDNPDGTSGGNSSTSLTDPVVLLVLVDPRLLPPDVSKVAGNGASGSPEEGDFNFPPPSNPLDIPALRRWWDSITSQSFTDAGGAGLQGYRVLWRRPTQSTPNPDGSVSVSGPVRLWEVHPGKFQPVVVAETQRGAIGFATLMPATPKQQLRGLRTPPWLSNLAQFTAISGRASGSQELRERLLKTVPEGRFFPLPTIKGEVELIGGYLIYAYDFALQWKEGVKMPGAGFAGSLFGFTGVSTEAGAGAKVDGTQEKVVLEIRGEASSKKVETKALIPGVVPAQDRGGFLTSKTLRKFRATGGGSVSQSSVYDENADPLNLVASLTFVGGLSAEMRYDLRPWLATLQPVGPLVASAAKTADVVLTGAIGLQSSSSFTTHYPRPVNTGSSGVFTQPELGHTLGGRATPDTPAGGFSQTFALCANAGLGLEIVSHGGIAGASAFFHMRGNDCFIPIAGADNLPSMRFALSPSSGFFPLVKEVSGRVDIETKAFLDVFITRLERKWRWTLWEFKQQLGTESVFELIPLDITLTKTGPETFEPVEFRGTSPQLMQKLLPSGRMGAASGSPDVMAFTDVNPANGRMVLKISRRTSETAWAVPVSVADAPGIVAAKVLRLTSGALLAVWTELAAADMGTPFPSSTLRSATSADGGQTWAAPQTVAALTHVAAELFLGASGTFTGLIYLAPGGSPDSPMKSAHGLTYTAAGGWSVPVQLLATQEITSFDAGVTGGAIPVSAAFTTGAGALKGFGWNGTAANPAQVSVSTGVKPGVAIVPGASGLGLLASLPVSGGIGIHIAGSGTFTAFGGPRFTAARPSQVDGVFVGGTPARNVIAWIEEESGELHYGLLDALGTAVGSAIPLTPGTPQRYRLSDVIAGPAGHATIFASIGAVPVELRQFIVSPASGLVFADRDADGLNDRDELLIVDANMEDAFTLIDHVLPGGDFDADGATNALELTAGTDPTDPAERPVPAGVTVAASQPDAHEYGLIAGEFVITRSDATAAADVAFSFSGAATTADFTASTATPLHFDAGIESLTITITPASDSLPEGPESLTLTLQPGAGYTVGTPASATMVITDRPSDDWRFVHFPGNPAGTPFNGDTDGDGISELMEFGLVLDPNQPSATGLPVIGVTAGGQYPTLTYTRPVVSDVNYTVQVSTGLSAWQSGFGVTQETSRISNPGETQTVTVQSLTPFSAAPHQFLRLEVRR